MPKDTCYNSMYWSHNASITLLFQQFNSAEKAVIKYVTVVRIISNPHHIVVRTISNPHHNVVRISTSLNICWRKKFSVEINQMLFNLQAGKARSGAAQEGSSPLWSLQWNLTWVQHQLCYNRVCSFAAVQSLSVQPGWWRRTLRGTSTPITPTQLMLPNVWQ